MEKELGAPLFRRLPRGVELTDTGKLLLEQARIILKQVEEAAIGVRRRARGETGRIIIGTSGSYFHPFLMRIIHECKTRYPQIVLAAGVEVTNTSLLIAWLRTGRIDVCLLPPPIDGSEGLAVEPLLDEDCVIVLPRGHSLSNSASAPLAKLAREKFVIFYRDFNPATYELIFAACARADFVPKVELEAPQIISVLPMVAAGFGVSIVPRSFSEVRFAGIQYIDIEGDAPRSAIALVWRRDERSAAIKNAIKAARLAKLSA